jgi:voltage-gated potassium channel
MIQEFLTAHIGIAYELAAVFLTFGLVIFVSGCLIALFDKVKLEESVYFAFITAFTVGLGDITPESRGARIVTILLAFLGLVIMGVLIAIAVHALDIALKVR